MSKNQDISSLIKEIKKKHGDSSIKTANELMNSEGRWTGALGIDKLILGQTIPVGSTLSVWGRPGVGKTQFCATVIQTQRLINPEIYNIYLDFEDSVKKESMPFLKIPENDERFLIVSQGVSSERDFDIVKDIMSTDGIEVGAMVVDSLHATATREREEKNLADGPEQMGAKARLMNHITTSFRARQSKTKALGIYVLQFRQQLTSYPSRFYESGGMAIQHMRHYALYFEPPVKADAYNYIPEQKSPGDPYIAQITRVTCMKNKFAHVDIGPIAHCDFPIVTIPSYKPGYGYNAELDTLLIAWRTGDLYSPKQGMIGYNDQSFRCAKDAQKQLAIFREKGILLELFDKYVKDLNWPKELIEERRLHLSDPVPELLLDDVSAIGKVAEEIVSDEELEAERNYVAGVEADG